MVVLNMVSSTKMNRYGKVLILSSAPILKGVDVDGLAKAGLGLTVVPSYAEGIQKIDQEKFDAIVIDNKLRGANIYEACRQIRQSSRAPIILLGRKPDKEMRARAKDLGFDFYFRKPVDVHELLARVKVILLQSSIEEKTEAVAPQIAPAQSTAMPTSAETTRQTWHNAQTMALLDTVRKGKLAEINPVIDFSLKDGFAYPEADKILGTSGRQTAQILESLAEEGILLKKPFEKLLLSPAGFPQVIPVERCPHCDSADLIKAGLLEHFACGYVGLENDFKDGLKYICPKCKKELRLIGTDYRSLGVRYKCRHCNEIFPSPTTKWRCLKTGTSCNLDELQEVWLYSCHFNEAKKEQLDFELEPKVQLIEFLKRRGYEVEEFAKVTGHSGAGHTLDILAIRDDGIVKHTIGIGVLVAKPGETEVIFDALFQFDTKAYDIGIHDKVIVAIPKLSLEAEKFAERQRIKVLEAKDLRAFFAGERSTAPAAEVESCPEEVMPELPKVDPRAKLTELLKSRGYEVTEKAKVKGKSGAEYIIDIYAQRNDAIITQTIAAAISYAKDGEEIGVDEISQFDTKAYDAGIRDKVFIAIPKLSPEAKQFAQNQRIKVFEAKDLASSFGL